ncbi:muscle M-line assembly protein unc-89 [Phlebotomus argentipes]|uniref:muscle M-line assembly protein unc-89 n=1 Tax=Phlebotomus argentipes TaxID=94469 RepID=UPI002892CD23|nr:muscle M-line assembly protein unc-89 [Phlebotomus argentipes]XP_059609043.1 muscle M-line assembly protein unc-89 [Phlebotomus argentipes]
MGRKSKAKANRNNQQAKVAQNTNQSAPPPTLSQAEPKDVPADEPLPTIKLPSNAQIAEKVEEAPVKVDEKSIEEVKATADDGEAPFMPSPTGKKKKNRNKNKKKNQQNVAETEEMGDVSEENAEKSPQEDAKKVKNEQIQEQTAEKPINTPSKKKNKKKNAEKASQEVSVGQNRSNSAETDVTKETDSASVATEPPQESKKGEEEQSTMESKQETSPIQELKQEKPVPEQEKPPLPKEAKEPKPVQEKKQEVKTKPDKAEQKNGQKGQKSERNIETEDINKNVQSVKLPESTTNEDTAAEAPKTANLPKNDESKTTTSLESTDAVKMEATTVDPITIEITQPVVITAEPCKDRDIEPSTEATLAQLIELVSNSEIPLQDVCPMGGKNKIVEFQKPIAETGAALAELVNVVASVEVPLKDVVEAVVGEKNDKEGKNRKEKQQKPEIQQKSQEKKQQKTENKSDAQHKRQDNKRSEPEAAKKQESRNNEGKKDNKKAKDAKESKLPEKSTHPPQQVEEVKIDTTTEIKEVKAGSQEIKEPEKVLEKSEEPKTPDTIKSQVKDTPKISEVEEVKSESQPSTKVEDQESIVKDETPVQTTTKKDKEDANLKEANEKSEAKAKEVPEKNPQEKMDAISFVPDKLIDILDTKMQTLPANTGAIKKIPKQKVESGKTADSAAQTQVSVQADFEDKPKEKEEPKKPNQQAQPKHDKSGKTSPQKSPKKPQVPPKPEHLLKKTPPAVPPAQGPKQGTKEPPQAAPAAPKKPLLLSDDEEEFIEYKFTPRQVFLATICQVCKIALQNPTPCSSCLMVSYCSEAHAKEDAIVHQQLCRALQEIARKRGGHVYNNAKILSNDDFRNLRVHTLNLCESLTQRPLQPFEKEILLFPRICCTPTCREWRPPLLVECQKCGQVSYCKEQSTHLSDDHQRWCPFFLLYQKLIVRQKNVGRIEPSLPSRIFLQRYELPASLEEVFKELYKNNPAIKDDCTYATLTQLATAPLTAYNAVLKAQIPIQESLTIHLVGAELQFEGDTLDKWEAFFLHLIPQVLELRVVFIGPELNAENLPLDILSRIRMCRTCRQACRGVKFDFQCGKLYHDYAKQPAFTKPDLICFFNPGLYRATGFSGLDTWPDTIKAATQLSCPIVVTSYTELESPQDLAQLNRDSARPLNLTQAPAVNPFSSQRPERNFISDEVSPMIFKNYYVFIVS